MDIGALVSAGWAIVAFLIAALSFVLGLVSVVVAGERSAAKLGERARVTAAWGRGWSATGLILRAAYYLTTAAWPGLFTHLFPFVLPR